MIKTSEQYDAAYLKVELVSVMGAGIKNTTVMLINQNPSHIEFPLNSASTVTPGAVISP